MGVKGTRAPTQALPTPASATRAPGMALAEICPPALRLKAWEGKGVVAVPPHVALMRRGVGEVLSCAVKHRPSEVRMVPEGVKVKSWVEGAPLCWRCLLGAQGCRFKGSPRREAWVNFCVRHKEVAVFTKRPLASGMNWE